MGGIVSRISPDITLDHGLNESFNRIRNSFDRTPKYKIINDKNIDPRSATLEITRSPLCLLDRGDDGECTPVPRRSSKAAVSRRRSSSKIKPAESSYAGHSSQLSQSFEFSPSVRDSDSEPHLVYWEPASRNSEDTVQEEVSVEKTAGDKYEIVVEELHRKLNRVTMTPVYVDRDSCSPPPPPALHKLETPPPPLNKELKKRAFRTPDSTALKSPASPLNKERTPLKAVDSNTVAKRVGSGAMWRECKVWRGPGEERAKLRQAGENTPPPSLSLPPFGSPHSAPPIHRHLHFKVK